MNFTTNHDENTWSGTVYERLGNLEEPFSILISTATGMPLIYSGQESGLNKRLEFFEKNIIPWKEHKARKIITKILNEKKRNKAMWNRAKGGSTNFIDIPNEQNILAFYRENEKHKIIVLLNLSDNQKNFEVSNKNLPGNYGNLFNDEKITLRKINEFSLPAFGYLVLVN